MTNRTIATLVLALVAVTGCSSGHATNTGPHPRARPVRALDATALDGLANRQETSTLEPATATTSAATTRLATTLPTLAATAGYDKASVASALMFAARLVAVTRVWTAATCVALRAHPRRPP